MAKFSDEDLFFMAVILDEEEEGVKTKKRKWVREACKRGVTEEVFADLYKELVTDEEKFIEYFKMSESSFDLLLSKLETYLKKQDTHFRKAITPRERLAVFLRYLITGDSLVAISVSYRLGASTVLKIVRETCKIIADVFGKEYMPSPTKEKWKRLATDFYDVWKFPNCLGAIGGKHVNIQIPSRNDASNFSSNKNTSVVFLALVDGDSNFISVDVVEYSKYIDGGPFTNSRLCKGMEQGSLGIPEDSKIPNTDIVVPYVILADEVFPLKKYLMRPYPGRDLDSSKRVFNERLTFARKTFDNALDMLSERFRIFSRKIQAYPDNVGYIIRSACVIHNFVKKHDSGVSVTNHNVKKKFLFRNLTFQGGNHTRNAYQVREKFKGFFNSETGLGLQSS